MKKTFFSPVRVLEKPHERPPSMHAVRKSLYCLEKITARWGHACNTKAKAVNGNPQEKFAGSFIHN